MAFVTQSSLLLTLCLFFQSSTAWIPSLLPNSGFKRCTVTPSKRSNEPSKGNSPKTKKVRVDDLLLSRSIVEDLKRARALVMAGDVFIRHDHKVTSPAVKVADDTPLRIRTKRDHPWVSRGGLKLSHALETWPILRDVAKNAIAIDVGSSTGGFTDVLLAAGAAKIFAVDVGRGILDWRLRTDSRVVVKESFNARDLTAASLIESVAKSGDHKAESSEGHQNDVAEKEYQRRTADIAVVPGMIVCDASFIRLSSVLPAAMSLCDHGGALVALIKPQFEAQREQVEPGGVVRDTAVHSEVCSRVTKWVETQPGGWSVCGIEPSPIQGPSGNIEFLLFALKRGRQ